MFAPPRHGRFSLFEEENARAFGHDESVPVHVEGATGTHGLIVAFRQRAHGSKPGQSKPRQGRFGAAGNRCVHVAALNPANRFADGVGTT